MYVGTGSGYSADDVSGTTMILLVSYSILETKKNEAPVRLKGRTLT